MLGNLFKLLIFPIVWNLLALVQHSRFLTSYLSPGLCLTSKTFQKDTLTHVYLIIQITLVPGSAVQGPCPAFQAPASRAKSRFHIPGFPSVWEGVPAAYWTSPFRCLTETSNSEVKNEPPFHLYVQTFSSLIISYTWSPSHNQSATNPCQFH